MTTIEIQELIDLITKSGLEEVHIETEGIKLHVKRSILASQQVVASTLPVCTPILPSPVSIPPSDKERSVEKNYIAVKSPMIGTFYCAPDPEAPPFVQEGDIIAKGTKLCIIEAMKLYNEVESDITGKIVKILVNDVSPVEYDQPLFLVDPS